jgi:glutamate formiminotransferase
MGAADVIPFVPIRGVTLEACAELAWSTGEEIWKRSGVPVYFYEAAARSSSRARLEQVRLGGFEGLRRAVRQDPERRPDIGGPGLHPTAGAVAVGARKVLIAWNVNLETQDLRVARSIARKIRQSSGGFAHVKALGLALPSRAQTQVSMNLTDFEVTPPHQVFEAIRAEAAAHHVRIAGSEIIGLMPRAAIEAAAQSYLQFENFRRDIVLETRIEEALPAYFDALLQDLADPERSIRGGAAAALTGAMAAALGVQTCLSIHRDASVLADHQQALSSAAERDGPVLARLTRQSNPSTEDLESAVGVLLTIAERTRSLAQELQELLPLCPDANAPDAQTAAGLASAAVAGAVEAARTNLKRLSGAGGSPELERRLRALD